MAQVKDDYCEDSHTYMGFALHQAKLALEALEVPVGCVILEDDKVIASGRNRTNEARNATRRAEMEAIDELMGQWRKNRLSPSQIAEKFSKCILYVTCEPCIMCASALSFLGIKEVYYGCANDKFGGCGSILPLHVGSSQPSNTLEEAQRRKGYKCRRGIMAEEAFSLSKCFHEQGNPNDQAVRKYHKAKTNVKTLQILGAFVLHQVDAKNLYRHQELLHKRFDR